MKNKFAKAFKITGISVLSLAALPFALMAAVIWLAITTAKFMVMPGGRRRKFSAEICR